MKNTLKRILLLLPVISVLLVALAVPVFAGYSDGSFIVDGVYFSDSDEELAYKYRYTIDITGMSDYLSSVGYTGNDIGTVIRFTDKFYTWYSFSGGESGGESFNRCTGGITMFRTDSNSGWRCRFNMYYSSSNYSSYTSGYDSFVVFSDQYPPTLSMTEFNDQYGMDYLSYVRIDEIVEKPDPVGSVSSVWTEIMTWITSAFNSVMGAFYVDGSLTLLGTLAVIGVSVGIGFLLIGLIQRFLHLRG